MTSLAPHPAQILLGAPAGAQRLPVCDHYSGVESRMRKSLQLQAQMMQELGACVLDVTLDCEDGAAVGNEAAHARLVAQLAREAVAATPGARVAVRVHAVDHPHFAQDIDMVASEAGAALCHLMLPKIEHVDQVDQAVQAVHKAFGADIALHALLESAAAVHHAFEIAAHPAIQSISFGLMDFVSSHGGAIPASAMSAQGQFEHPLVLRAKLDIAAACHAWGKVPSHCVVTEFRRPEVLEQCARKASQELGYTRMWSIHPDQILPLLRAFSPDAWSVREAAQILTTAAAANWAPVSVDGVLHDRASYRYYWQLLERAHQTGQTLPADVQPWFANALFA